MAILVKFGLVLSQCFLTSPLHEDAHFCLYDSSVPQEVSLHHLQTSLNISIAPLRAVGVG